MINRQSIFFTILISFLISILLVIISFIIILANSYKAQEEQIYDRYIPISKIINRIEFDFSEEIIKNFDEMNYKLYIEKKEINKITNDKNMKIFSERIHPKHGDIFRILKNNTDYYLYMKVRDNEVLVKVKACGICGSDIDRVENGGVHFLPIIIGHEFSGIVVGTGSLVKNISLGDHVTAAPLIPCNKCENCLNGHPVMCNDYSFIGSRENGAMAEYVSVPEEDTT